MSQYILSDVGVLIVISTDRAFHEMDDEQISNRIMADLIKYNFVVNPTMPSPSPEPAIPPPIPAIPPLSMESIQSLNVGPLKMDDLPAVPPVAPRAATTISPPPRPPLPLPPLSVAINTPAMSNSNSSANGIRNGMIHSNGNGLNGGGIRTDSNGKSNDKLPAKKVAVSEDLQTFSPLMLPNLHSTPDSPASTSLAVKGQSGGAIKKNLSGGNGFHGHSRKVNRLHHSQSTSHNGQSLMQTMAFG